MKIQIKLMGGEIPSKATEGSACYDLRASQADSIPVGKTALIHTGIYMAIPSWAVGLVCSRSGMALKGVFVTNAPGIIDSDYRGEIGVILTNLGNTPFHIERGDRIAQFMILAEMRGVSSNIGWVVVNNLPDTDRKGGFGSTGR